MALDSMQDARPLKMGSQPVACERRVDERNAIEHALALALLAKLRRPRDGVPDHIERRKCPLILQFAQCLGGATAIQVRHPDVHQYRGRRHSPGFLQGLSAADGRGRCPMDCNKAEIQRPEMGRSSTTSTSSCSTLAMSEPALERLQDDQGVLSTRAAGWAVGRGFGCSALRERWRNCRRVPRANPSGRTEHANCAAGAHRC